MSYGDYNFEPPPLIQYPYAGEIVAGILIYMSRKNTHVTSKKIFSLFCVYCILQFCVCFVCAILTQIPKAAKTNSHHEFQLKITALIPPEERHG